MTPLLAFAVPLALYLAWPSTMWNFDGIACAAALELGWPFYFFHAQHLLYGFFGILFWKAGALVGLVRALPALQLFDSLLAGIGLVGLYRTLGRLLDDEYAALLLSLGMGVTAAFWVWSVEAQVYPLGFVFLAWAAYTLLNRSEARPVQVGLLHAGAVLGHVLHVLWIVPAVYWWREKPKTIRTYLLTLILATAIPYALVMAFVIIPGHDRSNILNWLKGSAGLTPNRQWAWHFPGLIGPWLWLKSSVPALWGTFWPYKQTPVEFPVWCLTAVSIAVAVMLLARSGSPKQNRLAAFCWLWLLAYGVLLSTWEPATLCYRITDVIPLGILFALGLKHWGAPRVYAALLAGTLFFVNLSTRILPMHDSALNKTYQDTLALSKISPPNTLYITQGGVPWIYMLYFIGREALNANLLQPDKLNALISKQKKLRPVYELNGTTWRKVL